MNGIWNQSSKCVNRTFCRNDKEQLAKENNKTACYCQCGFSRGVPLWRTMWLTLTVTVDNAQILYWGLPFRSHLYFMYMAFMAYHAPHRYYLVIREVSHQYDSKTITNTSSLCGYVRPNHDVISRHFVQTSSWRSKRTWFCWLALICGHFPLANAILFDYLKKNWWRVRYHIRIRTGAIKHLVLLAINRSVPLVSPCDECLVEKFGMGAYALENGRQ
jgi:hypothetical protein